MAKIYVNESVVIHAPREKVYEAISDFNHWTSWSPWLIMEPEAKVTVSEDSKFYEWEGKRVGSGEMQITGEEENEWVDYDLTFLKPWKSKAKVRFELRPGNNITNATWKLESSLPFFMFWMKKMMTSLISMDFKRGLNMLKDYVEDGTVHSKLDFKGTTSYAGCKYIGIKTGCSMETVGEKMKDDFGKLWNFLGDKKDMIAGNSFSIYHKWEMAKNKVVYTSGIPVKEIPNDLPEGITAGEIPETKVYTLSHTGPYLHLGNAWGTMYMMQRNKEFKANKAIPPFETYVNNPGEVEDNELVTEVHFPVN